MKTAQEKQGYRVKSAQPVCGNCAHVYKDDLEIAVYFCGFGNFEVDKNYGTCQLHEWRK